MNVVFLSLGGNLLDRAGSLKKAREELVKALGPIRKSSGLYETEAWGSNSRNKFLNQVIEITTDLSPKEVLKKILKTEKVLGRIRGNDRYSDRIIDIDILFFGNQVINEKDLQIPHPQIEVRRFILVPFAEIAPGFVHPILKKSIQTLLINCKDKLEVKPYRALRVPRYICIEGNIGSGKSRLAEELKKHLKAIYLPEDFGSMRLLPLFYGDPRRYAFSLEFSFLLSRFEQILDCFEKNPTRVVSDYSIYKSLCFARVNLKIEEFKLLQKQFESVIQKLPEPGLIIHLNTNSANLIRNIDKRGRLFEKAITTGYLRKLNGSYSKTFKALEHIPQLSLEIDRYHPQLEKRHIEKIDRYLAENFG